MYFQYAFDFEYPRTVASNNTVGPYPDRLVRYNATAPGVQIIQQIGITIRDNYTLARGQALYTVSIVYVDYMHD